MDYMYPWGQPAMYSRAGLERMSKVFEMGAITKQCKAFGVTHDAGNPIVHWMLLLPEVHFPPIPSWSLRVQFREMGTHAVGRRGTPNTTAVHAQIAHVKYPQPPYQYKWHKPNGFFKTATYKLYGNVSEWTEWHTMPVSDCRGPSDTMSNGSSDITSSRNQNIRKATRRRPKRAKQHLNNQRKPLLVPG
jgi:hypothetical protein